MNTNVVQLLLLLAGALGGTGALQALLARRSEHAFDDHVEPHLGGAAVDGGGAARDQLLHRLVARLTRNADGAAASSNG